MGFGARYADFSWRSHGKWWRKNGPFHRTAQGVGFQMNLIQKQSEWHDTPYCERRASRVKTRPRGGPEQGEDMAVSESKSISPRSAKIHRRVMSKAHIRRAYIKAAGKKFADDMPEWAGWFVVAVRCGFEEMVEASLQSDDIDVWLPMRKRRILKNPKKRSSRARFVKEPAFSGYLFVRLVPSPQAWQGILGFDNAESVLGSKRGPLALSDRDVSALRDLFDCPQPKISLAIERFCQGDLVHITGGKLENLRGVVEQDWPNQARLEVLVAMFGRQVPVNLPLAFIEKIG